jgi:hypothetical protein
MKHTINDLLDTVYRYYARGISNNDPRRKSTEEEQRLSAIRHQAGVDDTLWQALLDRLELAFPDATVQNDSFHLQTGKYDACYSGRIFLKPVHGEHYHSVGFMVSLLLPYYVIYSTRIVDTEQGGARRKDIRFELSPDELPYADWLARSIEDIWHFEPMSHEMISMVVPDVATNMRDIGEATISDLLFSDSV